MQNAPMSLTSFNGQHAVTMSSREICDLISSHKRASRLKIGHVYVLESADGSMVKIGRSSNPEKRLKQIIPAAMGSGRKFISNPVTNDHIIEWAMHQGFRSSRVHGEWFAFPFEAVVDTLMEVAGEFTATDEHRAQQAEEETRRGDRFLDAIKEAFLRASSQTPEQPQGDDDPVAAARQIIEADLHIANLLGVPTHLAQSEAINRARLITGCDFSHLLQHAPAQPNTLEAA